MAHGSEPGGTQGVVGIGRALTAWLGCACLAGWGCSGPDRPAPLNRGAFDAGSIGGAGANVNPGTDAGTPPGSIVDFDPNGLYVVGRVTTDLQARAVARLDGTNPNSYALGFDFVRYPTILRVSPGHLFYQAAGDASAVLRRFVPDFETSLAPSSIQIPQNPIDNDEELDIAPCTQLSAANPTFLTSPDGHLFYKCSDEAWYEAGQQVHAADPPLLALGYDNLALVWLSGAVIAAMDLSDGVTHPADPPLLPDIAQWVVTRRGVRPGLVVENGFQVVVSQDDTGTNYVLWEIDASGTATQVGTYPPLPDGVPIPSTQRALLPDGALYSSPSSNPSVIVRRTVDGVSEIVRSSTDNVRVPAEILFTGT